MSTNKKWAEADAIETNMDLTWNPNLERKIAKLPAPIKKVYFEWPVSYSDTVEIWALENGQFVVQYSRTGAMFLYDIWDEAVAFRNQRVAHIHAGFS